MSSTPRDASPPPVSVIIPVYNDASGLRDTVDSLLDQKSFVDGDQIIIADNGSDDDTWPTARQYAADHPQRVVAVCEDQIQSSYAARNRGLQAADGAIIGFIDADMIAPDDYLASVRRHFIGGDVDYLACNVRVTPSDDSMGSLYNCATGFPVEHYLDNGNYAPTCCLCVRRTCIDDIGSFDGRLESGGDMEFGKRAHRAGYTQKFAADITLEHPSRSSFSALLEKERRIGRGHAQISHFHADKYRLFSRLYLSPAKYFLPHNPIQFIDSCRQRDLDIGLGLVSSLFFRIPRAWAGLASFLSEARRLRREAPPNAGAQS